jgi:nucleoside-diphosphate-sugar epimerase
MLLAVGGSISILEAYAGRRVLLTGVTSIVGRALARLFGGSAAELWVVSRAEGATPGAAHSIIADLSLPSSFARIFDSVKPHITFHLASSGRTTGVVDAALAERMNHHLSAEIAEVVGDKNQPRWPGMCLIRAGCAAEYGALEGMVREDSPPHPASVYGRSMLAGTWAVSRAIQSNSLLTGRATTARFFSVYGPGERPGSLLASLIDAARTGERLKLSRGDERYDFIYAGDAAEGLLRLRSPPGHTSCNRPAGYRAGICGNRSARIGFALRPDRVRAGNGAPGRPAARPGGHFPPHPAARLAPAPHRGGGTPRDGAPRRDRSGDERMSLRQAVFFLR